MTTDEFSVYCMYGAFWLVVAYGAMKSIDFLFRDSRRPRRRSEAPQEKRPVDDRETWEPAPEYRTEDPLTNPSKAGQAEIPPYGLSPDVVPPVEATVAVTAKEVMAADLVDGGMGWPEYETVGGEPDGC